MIEESEESEFVDPVIENHKVSTPIANYDPVNLPVDSGESLYYKFSTKDIAKDDKKIAI